MSRERRPYTLREILSMTVLAVLLAVLLYRDYAREVGDPDPLPASATATTTDDDTRRRAFELAYTQRRWGTNRQGKGTSGAGSTLQSTKLYRVFLQDFLAEHGIRSVVDAGCGDWQFSRAIDWTGIDYLGLDIVASVIKENQRRYAAANVRFAVADIVRDKLPPADLLLVKDVVQHLSQADITRLLAQLPRYRHVLIVNDVHPGSLSAENEDIRTGLYRPVDLTQPPYSLQATKVLVWRVDTNTKLVLHIRRPGEVTGPPKGG